MPNLEARFDALRRLTPVQQLEHKAELVDLFEVLWGSEPDRGTFARLTSGLVLFPEMLYIMVRSPWGTSE